MADDEHRARISLPQWRADFPVRWDEDHYVTRRELAKFLSLGSALLAGANAAVVVAGKTRSRPTYTPMKVASANVLAPGESLLFRYPTPTDPCILVRTRHGNLAAFSQVCTHLSCAVLYRAADDHLYCPCHEGLFDCQRARGGAPPIAGPPERPLPRIVLEVRGDDVFAVGVEV